MLSKDLCPIDFNRTAQEIHNQIRGLSPWPVATAKLNGKTVKIHSSAVNNEKTGLPGVVAEADNVITVGCGDNKCIDIFELQLEGKKRMKAKDFLLGHKIPVGTVFE